MLVMELWKSLWKIRMGFVRSSMKKLKIEINSPFYRLGNPICEKERTSNANCLLDESCPVYYGAA